MPVDVLRAPAKFRSNLMAQASLSTNDVSGILRMAMIVPKAKCYVAVRRQQPSKTQNNEPT